MSLAVLVLTCLIPGLIGATVLLIVDYRAGREQLEQGALQTARALSQAVDSQILRAQALAHGLATTPSLVAGDLETFHERARETLGRAGLGAAVVVSDRDGRQLLHTGVPFGDVIPSSAAANVMRQVFDTGKPVVSNLFLANALRRHVMIAAVPVFRDGKVIYALSVSLLPAHFNEILKTQALPEGWIAAILDGSGVIAARTHQAGNFVGKSAPDTFVRRIQKAREGTVSITSLEGVEIISNYSFSTSTGWGVGIGIPRQALEAQLRRDALVLASSVIALFALGAALAWRLGGRISRSVQSLRTPARALASGKPVSTPEFYLREVAEVASSLKAGAQLLESRTAALSKVETRYRRLFDANLVGVGIALPNGSLVEANDYFLALVGANRRQFEAGEIDWRKVTAAESIAADRRALAEIAATGTCTAYEKHYLLENGERRTVLVFGAALPEEHGAVLVLAVDLTERRRVEDTLRERERQLSLANRAKSRFLAAASHDLRQPLAALTLYTDALRSRLTLADRALADCMKECLASLSALLNDLLDLSKLDAGVVRPNICDFPVQDLLSAVARAHGPEARLKALSFRVRSCDATAHSDPILLQRIVGNFVANAVRYTVKGGVLVGCRQRAGGLSIEVWDTGIGIPEDQLDAVFEEFKQLDESRTHGSGLGLAIAARTATLLGSSVSVRSRQGKGSVFSLEVPLGSPIVRETAAAATSDVKLRVALIDDNEHVRQALSIALTTQGHDVTAAADYEALCAKLGSAAPDVIVADYRLAGSLTGVDVITRLRARFGVNLPAVLITGDTDPHLLRSMSNRGIVVQHKPVQIEILQACLAGLADQPAVAQ